MSAKGSMDLTPVMLLVTVPRFEPAIPRRKKHPELAYKTHEFLAMSEAGGSDDSLESTVTFDRARVSIGLLTETSPVDLCDFSVICNNREERLLRWESLLTLPDSSSS
jgi:hypothetical protein